MTSNPSKKAQKKKEGAKFIFKIYFFINNIPEKIYTYAERKRVGYIFEYNCLNYTVTANHRYSETYL